VASLSNHLIKIEDDDFYSSEGDIEEDNDETGVPRDIDSLFGPGQPVHLMFHCLQLEAMPPNKHLGRRAIFAIMFFCSLNNTFETVASYRWYL
jgi:hypothetical protein